jgi:hypothetical protein
MKKNVLLFGMCLLFSIAGAVTLPSRTIQLTKVQAGTLADSLNKVSADTINTLTVSGTINAKDFLKGLSNFAQSGKIITNLDLSACSIDSVTYQLYATSFYQADELPQFAFTGANYVTLKLPSTLKSIATQAITLAPKLISLELPSSLVEIKLNGIQGLPLMSTLTLPAGIKKVALNFNTLTSLVVPDGVTDLDLTYSALKDGTFNLPSSVVNLNLTGLTKVTSLTLPAALKSLYLDDTSIPALILPSGLKRLSMTTNTAITSLVLPEGMDSIDVHTCKSLTSVNTPSTLTYANLLDTKISSSVVPAGAKVFMLGGSGTWGMNTSLTSVTFSPGTNSIIGYNDATSLGVYIQNASNLTSITFPSSLVSIGYGSFYNIGITLLDFIPSSVTSIALYAFSSCPDLKEVKLKEGLQNLGDNVFDGCTSVTKVTLPSTLKSMGATTFNGCTKITDVYSYAAVPPAAGTGSFDNAVLTDATLHVTSTTAQALYAAAPVWKDFTDLVMDIST